MKQAGREGTPGKEIAVGAVLVRCYAMIRPSADLSYTVLPSLDPIYTLSPHWAAAAFELPCRRDYDIKIDVVRDFSISSHHTVGPSFCTGVITSNHALGCWSSAERGMKCISTRSPPIANSVKRQPIAVQTKIQSRRSSLLWKVAQDEGESTVSTSSY